MSDIGAMLARAVMFYIFMAFIAGIALATLFLFGIPWLWHLLKPWLHMITG